MLKGFQLLTHQAIQFPNASAGLHAFPCKTITKLAECSPFGHITYSKVEFSFIFSEKHRLRPDFFIYLINLNCFGGIFAGKGEKKQNMKDKVLLLMSEYLGYLWQAELKIFHCQYQKFAI